MVKEMLINVSEGEECRIALIEDGRLEELYMERTSSTSHVGNIYKGRVSNVEASIQAAFIDFGLGRNGFLHISDLMPTYFGGQAEDVQESVGRKMARRDRPPIQRCLRRGDEIVVQIIKEGIGTKGPTLSTYLAIPGRILVMMPGMARMGVSRKIEDEVERRRLRQILDSLEPPKDVGFIIRTAGVGKTKLEIQRDLTYLTRLWQSFVKKRDSGPGPMELYTEGDLVSRTVRDVFTSDVERIVVDHKEVAKRIKEVVKLANPRTKNKVELYEEPIPLFHKYGIESQIEQMHSRHVPLKSGGSLVIDSTEAIVAIDVNSGKFRDHNDAETTAFKTDMEAADEIPRQLRLRDLGGVIICDFIDLRFERHRRDLEQRLHDNFQNDRAKTRVLRMSQFGIIEITRQRMRPSLKRSIYFDCPHCKGAGLVKTPESMSLDAMRRLAIAVHDARVVRVEMSVSPDVALDLQNKKRMAIAELEMHSKKRIVLKPDIALALDEVKLQLFDIREGLVFLADLGMTPTLPGGGDMPSSGRGRGGRRDDRGRRRGGGSQGQSGGPMPPPRRNDDRGHEEDAHSLDRVEQAVEDREEEIDNSSQEPFDPGAAPPAVVGPAMPAPAGGPAMRGPVVVHQGGDGLDDGRGGPPPLPGEGGGRRRRRRRRRRGRGGSGGGGGGGGGQSDYGSYGSPAPAPIHGDHAQGADQPALTAYDSNMDSNMEVTKPVGEMSGDEPHEDDPMPPPRLVPPVEDFDEVNGNRMDYAPPADNRNDQGEGGQRRRRRRGGRGRNRGGGHNDSGRPQFNQSHQQPRGDSRDYRPQQNRPPQMKQPPQIKPLPPMKQSSPSLPPPLPTIKVAPPLSAPVPVSKPAAKEAEAPASSRRRGGRPRRKPPASQKAVPAVVSEKVVRTGSADKHLARDEPVAPQPVSRPRSARDLDDIPDDFD